ncbi:glycine cleavage system aminomethyltransferase GcvT [Humidisolicoccus flavus]|uniref:glycine cleavage system aminomethyltransferase GcvT n=1 Tax=Humidisolicoccus flavus TaxID=3111414 RepID=UPI0032464373
MAFETPLAAVHAAAGAQFTDFAGWQMPVRFTSDLAEHAAVRERAGLFDISHMGSIRVSGAQAAEFLDYALAGALSKIAIGQAKYSLLLNEAGGILDDLIVYRLAPSNFLIIANAGNREIVASTLTERAASFDAVVSDESEDTALIAIQGPRALEIIEGIGLEVEPLDELRYYRCAEAIFEGEDVLIARTGYTGEDGFEFVLPAHAVESLWNALLIAGTDRGLQVCGLAARDTLRLEAGMPLYGHELTVDTKPVQVGLGRTVGFKKDGDFVGRAALESFDDDSAPVLVGLVGDGKRAARAGYSVLDGDTVIGTVTSGALSPTLGVPIAMALVQPGHGNELSIDVRGTAIPFRTTALPFYSRKASNA